MKKITSLALAFTLVFSAIPPIVHADIPTENVIVVFKDDIDKKAVTGVNGEIEETYENIPVITGEIPESAIPLVEKDKDVLAVEIDQRVKVNGQVQDWGIQKVKATEAWESYFTGQGIKVAVLDTGISPHDDLTIAGGVSINGYTKSYRDDNGHGTHVAGIIGAKNNEIGTVGVAPNAELYAVKVLDYDGSGYISDIISGIDWAISNNMDIINMSLGAAYDSYALHQAVDHAYNNGILIVAAAGNNGNSSGMGDTIEYPARYDSTIAVSAIDSKNIRGNFSATGNRIEVAAPGVDVLSTYLNNGYASMSGTSMAAPYVTGTLALLKEANPTLTNSQLRSKLKDSVVDIGLDGKDAYYGYGLVQAPFAPLNNGTSITQESKIVTSTPAPTAVKNEPKKATAKKKLSASMTTNRSTYYAKNIASIKIKVVDEKKKNPISKGSVKLTITPPKGKVKIVTLKTNSKGEVTYKLALGKRPVKGSYKLLMKTSVKNYYSSSVSKTIRVK